MIKKEKLTDVFDLQSKSIFTHNTKRTEGAGTKQLFGLQKTLVSEAKSKTRLQLVREREA